MPKFSIISPIYKVEKYLPSFINCIFNQNFEDFEVILVDDGSPDQSGSLCDAFAKKDCRLKVIHKENGGVSSARNKGIDAATGDWILFFDPDDTFPSNTLETLSKVITLHPEIELVLFNHTHILPGGTIISSENKVPANIVLDSKGIIRYMISTIISDNNVLRSPWTKAYRRSTLLESGIRFTKRTFAEDYQFNLNLFPKLNFAIAIPDSLYDYWVHPVSAISKYHKGILNVWDEDTKIELSIYKKNQAYINNQMYYAYLRKTFSSLSYALLSVYKNDKNKDYIISNAISLDTVQKIASEVKQKQIAVDNFRLLSAIEDRNLSGVKRALYFMNLTISIKNKLSKIKNKLWSLSKD